MMLNAVLDGIQKTFLGIGAWRHPSLCLRVAIDRCDRAVRLWLASTARVDRHDRTSRYRLDRPIGGERLRDATKDVITNHTFRSGFSRNLSARNQCLHTRSKLN